MSKLKLRREAFNLSQSQLAERSGVNLRTLQDYEQGRKDINKAQGLTLYKIAQALNTSVEDLLEI